eukprot:CCRYP_011779-RA/>CCRYP_011779-RA protein AED:0.47 eAED:0.47 QI:0/0/0/1/0/0/2/0/99
MQQAFDKMRSLMAADAHAAYPDHNKRFDIYTDASEFQLGACIVQEGRPVALDMDYCPREKCESHLGKKWPSISLDLGKSRSMTKKSSSMQRPALTLLQI